MRNTLSFFGFCAKEKKVLKLDSILIQPFEYRSHYVLYTKVYFLSHREYIVFPLERRVS
jgi:hypothetical protein